MELMSRKRKLSESIRRSGIVQEKIISQEENELCACKKGTRDEEDGERVRKEVFQGKQFRKQSEIVGATGIHGAEKIRTRESSNFQDEDDVDDVDDDDDDYDGGGGQCASIRNEIVRRETRVNPYFCTDYVEDIIVHEMRKESSYRLSDKFCSKFNINPTGREILIDWLISVQVHLKAENGTLHLTIALLDIMLDRIEVPLGELQAAALASFWVAYKYLQGSLSMKSLLPLCEGSVSRRMIQENEILVLQTSCLIEAGGCLSVFFNYILYRIFGCGFPTEIYYCGLYFAEIMLLQFIFVDCSSYEKAATAVFTSLSVFNCAHCFDRIEFSTFVSRHKLQKVCSRLIRSLRSMYGDKDGLKASNVYLKYKSSRYFKISVHPSLKRFACA